MLWIEMTLKSSWSLNPSKPALLLSYQYSWPLSWGWKTFSSRALPFGVSFRAWTEIQRLQGGNEENSQVKRHWTCLLPVIWKRFFHWMKVFYTCSYFFLLWASHLRYHIVPQSLQTCDTKPGDGLPALIPIFQSQGSEQAKMSCSLGVWPCFCWHLHCRLIDNDCLMHQKQLHSSGCSCFNTNTCSAD